VKTRIALLIAALAACPSLVLADAAAGRAKFESACSDCHERADFTGRTAGELTTTLKGIAAGKVKHKGKVKLTDGEIADLVAHLVGGAQAAAPPTAGHAGSVAPAIPTSDPKPAMGTPSSTSSRSAPAASTASTASTAATAAVGGTATSAVATTTGVAGNTTVTRAGKGVFEQNCSKCHQVGDFAGQPAADLNERLGAIVGGKVKHKPPLKLSDAERQSLAAYLSAGR
jgi:mono/diheme cytochrome c family protein